MRIFFLVGVLLPLLFIACGPKESDYNKPADYWYEAMLAEIRFSNLEGADDRFASLQSEHINSPLIKEAMLILAHAHMQEREYILAGFYYDEYLKRYGDHDNIPFIGYMKLKANYYSFGRENINQELLLETIKEAETYLNKYPSSPYAYAASTLLINLYLAQDALDKEVIRIYKMRGAQEAVKIYENRGVYPWVKAIPVVPAKIPWYQLLFDW